jgi:hypothetical protein
MPHFEPLDALRAKLSVALSHRQVSAASAWGNPKMMTEVLRTIQSDFEGTDGKPPTQDVLAKALNHFTQTQEVANFTELKYVCYGVTVPVGQTQQRVMDSSPLLEGLLLLVQQQETRQKQFRRCYQGLLHGYFEWDRHTEGVAGAHWHRLGTFLNHKLQPVLDAVSQRGRTPDWLQTLNHHRNLLTDDPCSRYAKRLAQGDFVELKTVCTGLGIAGSSWVWHDALMAYVQWVCVCDDDAFLRALPRVLQLVNGQADLKLPPMLSTQATALTVVRYSRCASKPEHAELRDTCLHWIGNPWLKRTDWDATVKHEPARQMVDSWLKRRLIRDFFELLAQDGAADLRRLNFWLKREASITDMWFVLGSDARFNQSAAFIDLRKRMEGNLRILSDNHAQNNAFVMRIHQLLVIEFGVTGNACFVFAAADFHTSLAQKTFSIHELKQKTPAPVARLSHQSHWEWKFDDELRKLLCNVPLSKSALYDQSAPSPQPAQTVFRSRLPTPAIPKTPSIDQDVIWQLCKQNNIQWEDNRPKQGALWVLIPDRNKRPGLAALLDRGGFRYAHGKGFWLKNEN